MRYVVFLALLMAGCGAGMDKLSPSRSTKSVAEKIEGAYDSGVDREGDFTGAAVPASDKTSERAALPASQLGGKAGKAENGRISRKIVYNASVNLVVEDIDKLQENAQRLVNQHGGELAGSNVSGASGGRRSGQWQFRVPVEKFHECMAAVRKLGELENESIDSQDVTEEYFDVQARLKNKQAHLRRLHKVAEKQDAKVEELLKVEQAINDTQGQVESFQGRMNRLKELTSMSTITVQATELKDYVPPQAAGFGTRIGRGFSNSVKSLVVFAQNLVIVIVVIAPWLLILAVLLALLYVLWRIRRRARG